MIAEPPDHLMRDRMQQVDFDRILSWLRGAESDARVSFIARWSADAPVITRLATSAINDAGEALAVVQAALDAITHANSQRTKHWCQFAVTKLGPRKALRVIRGLFESRPHVVDMACYWLPTMISQQDTAYPELQTLVRDADSAGVIKPTVTSVGPNGQRLYHDRYAGTYPSS